MWDRRTSETKLMRKKESIIDYCCFPDPDLLPLVIDNAWIENIKANLPELPAQIMKRLTKDYKLNNAIAKIIVNNKFLVDYFEKALLTHFNPVAIANWIITELFGRLNMESNSFANCPISAQHIAMLVRLIDNKVISGKTAKGIFDKMFATGNDPETIVKEENLTQISNKKTIEKFIDKVLTNNSAQLEQYKAGKMQLFDFFVGQAMKESDGKANPELINEILKGKL
jgi:aspartyl-tRNA(Asn)/glutamyl-tRNA(Gln) amidotransferase subunit B